MPIRKGKASYWFNTKEEQDEYDDDVISNIELTTDDAKFIDFAWWEY